MKRFKLMLVGILVIGTCVAGVVQGQPRGGGRQGPHSGHGMNRQGGAMDFPGLTEDQRGELKSLVEQMRQDGASREEIRDAVHAQLAEWDVELPNPSERMPDRIAEQLTEEQLTLIDEMVERMREEGAGRTEIRDAVHAQLSEWGIELPEKRDDRPELTEEQRDELHALINSMREDGASREEIHDAVKALFESWGLEAPMGRRGKKGGGKSRFSHDDEKKIQARNYPNPFNPETTINYQLEQQGTVMVAIYNVNGQHVKTLFEGVQNTGDYSLHWDGTNESNASVPSGTYFYHIKSGDQMLVNQMILLK